ncbi:MAG: HigA family addiction module antidote protein [Leptospiraceae bacterium]|nr:HigA family addiction module antidote protein [Leptospiraceae bacterium]
MAQKKFLNVYPGEILLEEFLKPMDITAYRLAKETGIPESKISDIIKGKRNITSSISMSNKKIKKKIPSMA